ncbi:DUF4817 domain-containing protein [Trichonephila clavipes]|nr:DUF4817 domain-containing protein [Trichonephila clavipes]
MSIVHSDGLGEFQQDNATPNTSRIAIQWLQEHSSAFRHIRWPPKPRGMNIIDVNKQKLTRATIDLLKDTFGNCLISRFGPGNWPPRSCDLTPLDYFLWSYVNSLVYADKPQMLDHLEDNIRRVIADIRPQMLEKVIENWTSRLDYIRASSGSPMPEIIY